VGDVTKVQRTSRQRGWLALLLAGSLAVTAAACGSDDNGGSDSAAAAAEGDAAFPVTVEHKFGETTIDEEPERVISVGFTDQDAILALGVTPVAIRDWYGDQPYAVWPWAQDELGDAEPTVLAADALNFEQIASLEPDLILGLSSGITEEEYETLSAIAPTVTQTDEFVDYGVPWQVMTLTIGEALGKPDEAQALVDEVEAQFAAAVEAHPEFAGATGVVAFAMPDGEVGGYGPEDSRSRILTELGFEIPEEIVELSKDSFYASFSAENIDRLDADLIAWIASTDEDVAAIKASPLRSGLRAATEGREVFMDALIGAAAGFSSPLSLPMVLEDLVPRFSAALDGDPATVTD
jgi:iron complex transport system substrate-binding protein